MKIILITGMSGSGKTVIAKKMCEKYKDKYNFVNSYTDRGQRVKNEWGHNFVDTQYMDLLLQRPDIVAKTTIDKHRYCTLKNQFDNNKVNIYIADVNGINETINYFPFADIMIVLIRKHDIEVDCIRADRDVQIPSREDVDFLINNNGTIESAANLLNAFVNFDLFTKPSHTVLSVEDRLDYIDEQYRFLERARESLYEQLWYDNEYMYKKLCSYVEKQVNDELDLDIEIKPDDAPEIVDGYLTFNVQAEYENGEVTWDKIHAITERVSYHSLKFCEDNDLNALGYRLTISEKWKGEDDYL